MEKIKSALNWESESMKNCLTFLPEQPEQLCFFDIETTGLSPQVSSLYLIGAAVWEDDGFTLLQWFADDYVSEREILISFAEYTSNYTTFVHYNGSTFDIPYLEKKYRAHHLASPFTGKKSIDLYRELPKKKSFFSENNRKLSTMEKLLSFSRRDTFSGKDCIRIYTEFMQKKYFRDSTASVNKKQLLLHNHDDLQGTILCGQLLAYRHAVFNDACAKRIDTADGHAALEIHAGLRYGYFPLSLTGFEPVTYRYSSHTLTVEIPLYEGELYYFYKDYKEYYYLPKEDMAVHKSVGAYVDKEFRTPAKKSNCYTRKTGCFLAMPSTDEAFLKETVSEQIPVFKENYRSKTVYIQECDVLMFSEKQLLKLLYACLF